jgi:imidazolonepropionase-like amidohydrolase
VIALAERETDPRRRSIMEQTAADQLHQAARADDLGVNLVLGTDAGAPGVEVGPSVYREAGLLSAAGLDWRRVLAAATTRPAELAGLAGGLGRLVPTRRARLIALPWTDGRPDFASGPAASAGVEDDRAA